MVYMNNPIGLVTVDLQTVLWILFHQLCRTYCCGCSWAVATVAICVATLLILKIGSRLPPPPPPQVFAPLSRVGHWVMVSHLILCCADVNTWLPLLLTTPEVNGFSPPPRSAAGLARFKVHLSWKFQHLLIAVIRNNKIIPQIASVLLKGSQF